MTTLAGIDLPRVTAWLATEVGLVEPLTFDRLLGGHSNLTYRVTDASGRRVVLRRPPEGPLLPSAHDMTREWRCIAALAPTDVPVAPALALCTDPSVTGAPFYVMGFVDGVVLHSAAVAEASFDASMRPVIGRSFVDSLAALHAIDPDDIGLGELGKKEDYIARQLKRWGGQYEASKTRERPEMERIERWLHDHIPAQPAARVVHGDYRLGNCITGADGRIAAVVDWEIATLGDPLADLGYVLATWPEAGDAVVGAIGVASGLPGFPTRAEITARYAELTGLDVTGIGYYVAWANWKSACIAEGVYRRYLDGQLSTDGVDLDSFPKGVDTYVHLAELAIDA